MAASVQVEGQTPGAPRIRRELRLKLGLNVAESTMAQYMLRQPKPPSKTWRTFLENHAQEIWAIDFLVQHTVFMKPVYVFTVKHHGTRKAIHINATGHSTLDWVKQLIKEALWDHDKPRFIVHDNDAIFGNYPNPVLVEGKKYRNHLDRWPLGALNSHNRAISGSLVFIFRVLGSGFRAGWIFR